MGTILIQNGRILDPKNQIDEVRDLLIEEGRIVKNEVGLTDAADEVIDAKGCMVMPGFIDMHVHLRDPGQTAKEDIYSGSCAAAHGGFTTIVAMPNTRPVIDRPDRVDYVHHKAEKVARVHVLQTGSVTMGQEGRELADIRGMAGHGIPAVTEDGRSVMNADLCRSAMELVRELDIPFLDHCEDANLVRGGCVNEDAQSRMEGLPGITNAVEDVIAARDILLARETGARLHLCHCSTRGTYELLKLAKERGIQVSGEVCPHHFTLSSEDRIPGDTNFKMNPPLRSREDVEALRRGLAEGVFEVISTDHAPHQASEKAAGMERAPFGIVGLETAAALTYTELVLTGILTPLQMAEKMSYNPARILKLDGRGSLEAGYEADLVIFDPETVYTIDAADFYSKGKNTPFQGRRVRGRIVRTICAGKVVFQEGELKL